VSAGTYFFAQNTMTNSDFIYIQGLAVATQIGVYEWEQRIKQTVTLDIDLAMDIRRANNQLSKTIDYTAVIECVTKFITQQPFALLETLAEQVAQLLLTEFKVTLVRLRASKVATVANAKEVGVVIERSASPIQ
jgi:dihydroneopterin aldolase